MPAAATNPPPAVWIVDADQWPRALLRAELIERGYDAVGFVTLASALARLARPGAQPPRLLLISVDGQAIAGRQLALLARKRVKVALTGGALGLGAPPLGAFQAEAVLPRPVSIGELADAVGRLVPLTA